MEREVAWKSYTDAERAHLEQVSMRYRAFLDNGKTERECVTEVVKLAEAKGYTNLEDKIARGEALKAGDKVYSDWMGKSIMLFIIGKALMEKGINILGAHIDSPRMDVKQNPLYEDGGLAYLDTHYYGGIKNYQWVTIPLALHGVVVKKDGTVVTISVGEDENDPVFCISDLLIHLSHDRMGKPASDVIEGEQLDVIIGGAPLNDEDKEPVKRNAMKLIAEKYGIEEEDFLSAEIEVVPAGKARDLGFDRSMILAYGHDDRVCAYAQVEAMFDIDVVPEKTVCCILTDKEEIGSVGATGMRARFFENAIAEMMALHGEEGDLRLRRALTNSRMLSCDVSAGYDPNFASAFDKKNSAYLGRGVCFNKYTGSRGKSGSNDANAEYLADVRRVMDEGGVFFQTAELGKVNQGGGGTIAYICALYGMNVVDSGVAVLSMHAPWEIISKADLYEAYKGYKAFVLNA
ncbi:MAG: aminopeptidase [Clostridia bacterium]|nr:aminopeptidase [Clostridia bacterium]